MSWTKNPFTDQLDAIVDSPCKGLLASEPVLGETGDYYINSSDYGLYFYYDGSWQLVATMVPAAAVPPVNITNEDGTQVTNEDGTDVTRDGP